MPLTSLILGRTTRSRYVLFGIILALFKFQVDRWLAHAGFNRNWHWYSYVAPGIADGVSAIVGEDRKLAFSLLAVAVPFVATGIVLTTRRLRDAGLSPALTLIFFVPVANLFLFALLALLPSKPESEAAEGSPFFARFIPKSDFGSALAGVLGAAAIGALCSVFGTEFMKSYGWGLFVGIPFLSGFLAAVTCSMHERRSLQVCLGVAGLSVVIHGMLLVAFAFEGVICVLMAAPLAFPLAFLGAWLGWAVASGPRSRTGERNRTRNGLYCVALTALGPLVVLMDGNSGMEVPVQPVVTSVEIARTPDIVWRNVVEFSELPLPEEWIFKVGIAYPTHATIEGRGVGAIRKCEFSTGPFIEPITVWDEPRRLAFSVTRQPPPMNELSIWKNISPPHLDGLLESKGGEFRLVEIRPGVTLLQGTTWYRNQMWPQRYWRVWSDWLIHKIHVRVLEHIKTMSEGVGSTAW